MKNNITIKDIANLANVSKTTVSFYLNGKFEKMSEDTKSRIEKVIKDTNYQPSNVARSLNFKKTNLIGVIIGDFTNSFANQIVKGIETFAHTKGYQLIICSSGYNIDVEKQYVTTLLAMGVDGFIVQPTINFKNMYNELNTNKPIVYFDSINLTNDDLWVRTNNYEAVANSITYMFNKGYRHFVMLSGDPDILTTRQERYNGFKDVLDRQKLSYDILITSEQPTEQEVKTKLEPILNKYHNIGIFVCNCWLLSVVYKTIAPYKDRIPNDIGLLGFDSLEWTELSSPSITTIVQPAYEEGYIAGKILIDVIEDDNVEITNQILNCYINEKDSTLKGVK